MRKRWKWRLIPLILPAVLVLGVLLVRLNSGLQVMHLLDQITDQEQAVYTASLNASQWELEADISRDGPNLAVDLGSECLYFHQGAVYFSNGRGYDLTGVKEPLTRIFQHLPKLGFLTRISRSSQGGVQFLELRMPEKPGLLVKRFAPEAAAYWDTLQTLVITLSEESGILKSVSVSHNRFDFQLQVTGEEPCPIPTELLMEMGTGPLPDIRTLEPLARAGFHLAESESLTADAALRVSCGPLSIEDTVQFHLSENGIRFGRDNSWSELMSESQNRQELALGICWYLLREGLWVPEESGNGVFSITVPAPELKDTLLTFLPELEELDLKLDDGMLTLQITNGRFSRVELDCSGEIPFLITSLPLSIRMEMEIDG